MASNDIIVINNTRYRHEDARRLGLIADGKVVTAKSVERRSRTTQAPAGLITTEARNPGTVDESKPKKNASTADWTAYALANGQTEDDLDGLNRDDIAALFDNASGDLSTGDASTGSGEGTGDGGQAAGSDS